MSEAHKLWSEERFFHSPLSFCIYTYLPDAADNVIYTVLDGDCDPYVLRVIRFLDILHEEEDV
jgi:hypothetical protein